MIVPEVVVIQVYDNETRELCKEPIKNILFLTTKQFWEIRNKLDPCWGLSLDADLRFGRTYQEHWDSLMASLRDWPE